MTNKTESNIETLRKELSSQFQAVVTSEGNLYSEAALYAAIEAAYNAGRTDAQKWHDVKELPKEGQNILLAKQYRSPISGRYSTLYIADSYSKHHEFDGYGYEGVIYWQPITPPSSNIA